MSILYAVRYRTYSGMCSCAVRYRTCTSTCMSSKRSSVLYMYRYVLYAEYGTIPYMYPYVLYAKYGTVHVPVCALCRVRYRTFNDMCSIQSTVPYMYRYVLYAEYGTISVPVCALCEYGTVHVPVCALCRVRYRTCTVMYSMYLYGVHVKLSTCACSRQGSAICRMLKDLLPSMVS
jgi:hypothetical protein